MNMKHVKIEFVVKPGMLGALILKVNDPFQKDTQRIHSDHFEAQVNATSHLYDFHLFFNQMSYFFLPYK